MQESLISAQSLPRVERLRGRKTFNLLFRLARKKEEGPLRLYAVGFLLNLGYPPLQVAFAVPKKIVRRATHRHRIRRRLWEAYRLQKEWFLSRLPCGQMWLLWQWHSPLIPSLPLLQRQMQNLYSQATEAWYEGC
ncbi:MAG: ribonuclease P protein component [Bacteroidia bacterium]|nr:ribonuclease P protein component [Bacteroidia bacterium]MDW8015244.1 ribonuclease P protein component [Bacteroidia bacterium]